MATENPFTLDGRYNENVGEVNYEGRYSDSKYKEFQTGIWLLNLLTRSLLSLSKLKSGTPTYNSEKWTPEVVF